MFPKKVMDLSYCTSCYQLLITEIEQESDSQLEHQKIYEKELGRLRDKGRQIYSIFAENDKTERMDSQKIKRYTVLSENSDEYKRIKDHFNKTLSYPILRIEKNNNPVLERKFQERSNQLTCQNIKYLFHGSSDKAYDNILETGFDLSYAAPSGLLGAGIYFAEEASYSHGFGRVTRTTIGQINHILYCKVNVGRTCDGHSGLTETPSGYDGVHSSHNTCAFFHNYQGIPEYIIYYLVENNS
jgi:hypothetical protein